MTKEEKREQFFDFMTLLVSHHVFDAEVLKNEGALAFFCTMLSLPVQLMNQLLTMQGHSDPKEQHMFGQVKMFWDLYQQENGEENLTTLLNTLDQINEDMSEFGN